MMIVQIAGRLGRDPETRFTQSGQKVTNLTLATNVWKAGKEETVWWRIVVWGDRFDKIMVHLKKGSAIIVVGEMNKPEIWTDKEGRPQVSLELTAEIIKFTPSNTPPEMRGNQEGMAQGAPRAHPSQASYGAEAHGDHSASSQGYGTSGQQGSGARYSQTAPADEPLPF